MNTQSDIDNILNNNNLSVLDKLNKLDNLAIMYKRKIEDTKNDLKRDYRYCSKCNDYYKLKFWDMGVASVTYQKCINPLTGGYLDDYKYEQVTEEETYFECPKGHRIKRIYEN